MHERTKRDNQYVFTGFYERLTQIDVKHTHASLNAQSFRFDALQTNEDGERMQDSDDDLANSNFIQLLKQEKFNNRTPEYTKVFRDLETLSFSFPLLILNKTKVIAKLLGYIKNDALKVVHTGVIDLIIALIKDMRHDIYEEFLQQILPSVIQVLDASNLKMMDKIFQLLSFSFKYLAKPIKSDIENVYDVYFELIKHRNRFVRKFTCQSISYIIRKLTIDENLIKMLLKPLIDGGASEDSRSQDDEIHGMCDLFFEVLSGQTDDLHSKASTFLQFLLSSPDVLNLKACGKIIRYLYLKMINTINT